MKKTIEISLSYSLRVAHHALCVLTEWLRRNVKRIIKPGRSLTDSAGVDGIRYARGPDGIRVCQYISLLCSSRRVIDGRSHTSAGPKY